jgi:hypothetical protein
VSGAPLLQGDAFAKCFVDLDALAGDRAALEQL